MPWNNVKEMVAHSRTLLTTAVWFVAILGVAAGAALRPSKAPEHRTWMSRRMLVGHLLESEVSCASGFCSTISNFQDEGTVNRNASSQPRWMLVASFGGEPKRSLGRTLFAFNLIRLLRRRWFTYSRAQLLNNGLAPV
jgi:hypothetical protein